MLKSKIRASGAARVVVDYKYRTQMEPLEHAGGSDVMGIIVANAERWLSQNAVRRYDREIFPNLSGILPLVRFGRWLVWLESWVARSKSRGRGWAGEGC